jgi:hypothetical protein
VTEPFRHVYERDAATPDARCRCGEPMGHYRHDRIDCESGTGVPLSEPGIYQMPWPMEGNQHYRINFTIGP